MNKLKKTAVALALALITLTSACGNPFVHSSGKGPVSENDVYTAKSENMALGEGELNLDGKPAVNTILVTKASGEKTYKNDSAIIDASNIEDGYVMIKYTASSDKRIKVLITGPSQVRYSYNIHPGDDYVAFPLSDGNGEYTIGVYKQTTGDKYSAQLKQNITVKLNDEFAPFIRPNQYVNYTAEDQTVKLAFSLTKDCTTDLDKISTIYNYVISHLTYDYAKAETVQSGYTSNIDEIMAYGKGICIDYAAVMTAMLRSLKIPTKLVVGYTGEQYHAWINVYTESGGWVDSVIYFDGVNWKLMDPTFASTSGQASSTMQYINNSNNYTAKYLY